IYKSAEKLAQSEVAFALIAPGNIGLMETLNRLMHAIAADEPHGIERPAVEIVTQAVDRHDARMFQSACNLGFQHEPYPAVGVVRVAKLDLLESHLSVQLLVLSDEDLPQATAGMWPQDAEARHCTSGRWLAL